MIWDVPDYIWEENYAAAVRYHKKFGNLNVPHDYVDEEDIKLGLWLGKMRTNRRTSSVYIRDLTDEQIARLDDLGIIWETKYEKQWNDAFQTLCVHIETNGSFDILVSFVTDSGIALGKWIRRQRDFFEQGRLSDERIEKLRGIGFVLEKIDPWEEKFQLAKTYFEKHGDLNVPAQYVVNGVWLSKWVNEQKLIAEGKRKKQLTPEQLSRLEAIGLRYGATYYEELWNERFEMAKAYYDEYGNLNVPQKYTVGGFQLGAWLRQQKSQYRNGSLSAVHIEHLTAIGMDWDNALEKRVNHSYAQGFQHLEAFIAEQGANALRGNTVCNDGYRLGNWIANCRQKFRNGKLSQEHIRRFNELGISFESKPDAWEIHFQEVCDYVQKNGSCCIAKTFISETGIKLNSWLNEQKKKLKQGKLSLEKIEKLQIIGIEFEAAPHRDCASDAQSDYIKITQED